MPSDLFNKIFSDIIPPGTNLNTKNIMIPCIFHEDKNASLCISTDENKPVYNCFGCNAKGSWIGFYMKRNGLSYSEALKALNMDKVEQKPVKQIISKEETPRVDTDYFDYCYKVWSDTIMHDEFCEFYAKKLYDLRGISLLTAVCCMIGYDPDKGWIFPVIRYKDKKCVGYEIRQKYFQTFKFKNGKETKCYKADNTPSCLCWIYEAVNSKKCIVCEGFIDAYKMCQYQGEKMQKLKKPITDIDCNILTSSCGVKHIPELVEEAKLWEDFDEIIFCLDNDAAGNDANKKLMSLPHEDKFKFFNQIPPNKDFENYYEETLKRYIYE